MKESRRLSRLLQRNACVGASRWAAAQAACAHMASLARGAARCEVVGKAALHLVLGKDPEVCVPAGGSRAAGTRVGAVAAGRAARREGRAGADERQHALQNGPPASASPPDAGQSTPVRPAVLCLLRLLCCDLTSARPRTPPSPSGRTPPPTPCHLLRGWWLPPVRRPAGHRPSAWAGSQWGLSRAAPVR